MVTFSSTVAGHDRVLRLVTPLGGGSLQATASENMVLAELQNLTASALGFVQRLRARFPLHVDLVAPVSLAVHGLLHGLHLVHQRLWTRGADAAQAGRLGDLVRMPQMHAWSAEVAQGALREAVQEAQPEVASWWLQWTAVQRMQQPRALIAPRPSVALGMLQTLSKRYREDEDRRAQDALAKETPFKLAKSTVAAAAAAVQDAEDEAPALFPGAEQTEVAELIGLVADGLGCTETEECEPGPDRGASLYDHWSIGTAPKRQCDASTAQPGPQQKFHLERHQIADLCDLSLEAFALGPEDGLALAPGGDEVSINAARAEALDASLELFVRQSVSCHSQGKLTGRAVLLPADTAMQLSPLVMLRLRHSIRQLQPEMPRLNMDSAVVKRRVRVEGQRSLHREAACAFYAESSPSILLQLAGPLESLLSRTRGLLGEYEAHPSLLAVEGLVVKMQQLQVLRTTPMAVVTMLELLIGRATVWEEAACRKASLAPELRPLESLLVSLRERQLLEWRELRRTRERHWEQQGAGWWLHLVEVLAAGRSPRELVDELLRFLRSGPVAQFALRRRMLLAAGHLHLEAQGSGSVAGRVALHVHRYASSWAPLVERALAKGRSAIEQEVQDLVKIVRWDLSNYNALKESVSRSHRQLGKIIKRFDDSLQELVESALTAGSAAPEAPRTASCTLVPPLSATAFVLTETAVRSLGDSQACSAHGTRPAERLVDDESFWGSPDRVTRALPSALQRLVCMVSQQLLSDTFYFSATLGHRPLDAKEDLCSAAAAVLEALQDEKNTTLVKRRRLQGLREECGLFGITPRGVTKDALDVVDFFSSSVVRMPAEGDHIGTELGSEAPALGMRASTPAIDGEPPRGADGPPLKRRCPEKRAAAARAPGTDSGPESAFDSSVAAMWARIESLTSELMHLALRLHSIGSRPADLTGTDVQLWLGIAAGCVHAVRLHRERCLAFRGALVRFSADCGAGLAEPSLAVEGQRLAAVFAGLDRLLEGSAQARLLATSLGAEEARPVAHGLDAATARLGAALRSIRRSDDYRANFDREPEDKARLSVRVRVSFVHGLIQQARAAIDDVRPCLARLEPGMPAAARAGLQAAVDELGMQLDWLEGHLTGLQSRPTPQLSMRILRDLLLAAQQAQQKLRTDPSLSISSAAAEERLKTAADSDAAFPLPKLGIGRAQTLQSLLDILPLHHLQSCLEAHIGELPPCTEEAPLAPFAQQALHLARAVMVCGLDSGLAITEVSVGLLQLICFLFEHGLGSKPEEEEGGDADGEGQKTEWASGTGMGEGDGVRDVTEEIEDDAQLEGLKGEKPEEKRDPPEAPRDGEDTAREVGFDLDAEAQAVPQEDRADAQQPEQEEEERDLDRERGEVDLSAGGTLDEKLWNGEENEQAPSDEQRKDERPQEDIEAHGAQGEGESETVANDGEESKERDSKERPEQRDGQKQEEKTETKAENEEDPADQDPADQEGRRKTSWDEKDAQFDVNMQPDPRGAGQDDANSASDCEAPSDFVKENSDLGTDDDLAASAASEGGANSDGEGELEDTANIDQVAPLRPQVDEEVGEDEQQDQAVEPCVQGDTAPAEEHPQEQAGVQPDRAQNTSGDKPSAEPPCQGDPGVASSGADTAQKPPADERMLGGTTGASTAFESKPPESEFTGESSTGPEQGGQASAPNAGEASAEVPSAHPEQAGVGGRMAPQAPPESRGADNSERRLQKVDILRGANEGDTAGADEQQSGAERGLHLADPKSGVDALGECEGSSAPNQALGVAQQEGDDGDATAMADEERRNDEGSQPLPDMRLQQMDIDRPASDLQLKPDEAVSEEQNSMHVEGKGGSSTIQNVAVTHLPLLRPDPEDAVDVAEAHRSDQQDHRRRQRSEQELRQLWSQLERSTATLASVLCEQLRIILEPTMRGRLQGFYRTGKRISMRRVIPFIASSFRRDKIWLRRTKPSKREYQVVVAIDNSRSMSECGVGPMALQTLSVLCQALAQLEVGEYAVLAFGSSSPRVLLPLGQGEPHTAAFGWEQVRPLLAEFTFDEESAESHNRSFADMMRLASATFDGRSGSSQQRPFFQVMLIISDGRFNKAKVRPWVHAALARQQLPLLIIVDSSGDYSGPPGRRAAGRSVFDLRAVSYENGQCNVVPYLQDFPFPYYVVVQDLQALPAILGDVLKQWFELATTTAF